MLSDQFSSRSGQFLAVIEALTDTNKRVVQTEPPVPETEDGIFDAYIELFFAGLELISGGGGVKPPVPGKQTQIISNVVMNMSLIDLAAAG